MTYPPSQLGRGFCCVKSLFPPFQGRVREGFNLKVKSIQEYENEKLETYHI
jgi:hypothetical protein